MNNQLDCILIYHQASSLLHLLHHMSLTEWWIEQGYKTKMGIRMHTHAHTRESRILEPDDRGSYSEDSALNIYCSISRALCRCVHLPFPLFILSAVHSCSRLSHAFIVSESNRVHFAWVMQTKEFYMQKDKPFKCVQNIRKSQSVMLLTATEAI